MNSLDKKVEILTGAAKYDVSCASSGSSRKATPGGIGNAAKAGICHSWSADGRCISLLKILMSNRCAYDCVYCVNRCSNDIPRAAFSVEEVVDLTINFYRRNYIEGLFLSSGVQKSPDDTMEKMVAVTEALRTEHRFNGYIHLKVIPGASPELVEKAGKLADRLSVNIELPSSRSLKELAPNKSRDAILKPMNQISTTWQELHGKKGRRKKHAPVFSPAGQSTQMIVGASPETDRDIITLSESLYSSFRLKRVYYSAYVPVNSDSRLPAVTRPTLNREHRLYQADWLIRLYGFQAGELFTNAEPFLYEKLDPKAGWALRNLDLFPIELTRASYDMLLRVPGIGFKSARRIVRTRNVAPISESSLGKMGVVMKRARYFLSLYGTYLGHSPILGQPEQLHAALADASRQLPAPGQLWQPELFKLTNDE